MRLLLSLLLAVPLFAQPALRDSPEYERLLLPVFIDVEGAFGSVFRSDLTAANIGTTPLSIYGLRFPCVVSACLDPVPYVLSATPIFGPLDVERNGNPGRFVYVRTDTMYALSMNLRAYDTSRVAENFGTEVPIVREADFETSELATVTLTGIPTDPRFRNMLRIYSPDDRELIVYLTGTGITPRQHTIALRPGANDFEPSYAQFSDFPVGVGEVKVQIQASHIILSPPVSYSIWAFVSVTNNDTQHITTITPQP